MKRMKRMRKDQEGEEDETKRSGGGRGRGGDGLEGVDVEEELLHSVAAHPPHLQDVPLHPARPHPRAHAHFNVNDPTRHACVPALGRGFTASSARMHESRVQGSWFRVQSVSISVAQGPVSRAHAWSRVQSSELMVWGRQGFAGLTAHGLGWRETWGRRRRHTCRRGRRRRRRRGRRGEEAPSASAPPAPPRRTPTGRRPARAHIPKANARASSFGAGATPWCAESGGRASAVSHSSSMSRRRVRWEWVGFLLVLSGLGMLPGVSSTRPDLVHLSPFHLGHRRHSLRTRQSVPGSLAAYAMPYSWPSTGEPSSLRDAIRPFRYRGA